MEKSRKKLLASRENRIRPHTDDKILTSLNGLAIAALARASRAFDDPDYLDMALASLDFVLENNLKNGELHARYRKGHVAHKAYLDDYAFLIWALIEMHQTTLEDSYLERAEAFAREMVDKFRDEEGKGFFLTSNEAEKLIVRPKETYDGAVPSGNSVAIMALLRLSHLLGRKNWKNRQAPQLRRCSPTKEKPYGLLAPPLGPGLLRGRRSGHPHHRAKV